MRRLAIIILILSCVVVVPARNPLLTFASVQADPQFGQRRNQGSPLEEQAERERVRGLNKERQQKLKEDPDKLLQLATELKEYVDKTNENILSVDVIKKTDEIEKLAKSVREKMKTAYDVPAPIEHPRGR